MLQELIDKINHMAKEREWEKFHSPKNIAMSLIAEAAEIVEHFTWRTEAESCHLDAETLSQVSEEIGDVFINLLHLSNKLGIDLVSAASQKLEAIKKKYPVELYKGKHSLGTGKIISHQQNTGYDLDAIVQRLESAKNLTLSVEESKKLLYELTQFELGRFLLANKGLNGYWTAYIILHYPKKNLTPLEQWLLESAPAIQATRERFYIFRQQIQRRIRDSVTLASIPCGQMDDLIGIDYTGLNNVKLVGIDLDKASLALASQGAAQCALTNTQFLMKDAWDLSVTSEYDIIVSNGLNIYEPDDAKVILLYKEFFKALKPDGVLITSFLTPPPTLSDASPWKNYNSENLRKQKAILGDIIQAQWQIFRTEAQTRQHLDEVGFTIIDVIYDTQHMFPTIVAVRGKQRSE